MLTDENINRLIALYGNSVIRMSYIILKDYDLAQDVAQDTFIQVIKKYNTLKNKKSEKAWIMKIAINQCRNQLRSQWFKKIVYYEDDKELKNKLVEMDFKEDNTITHIYNLKEKYKEVILLYYYQELSIKEIASTLGKKESNIQQLLKRAREQLKERMENDNEQNKKTDK